MNDEGDCSVFDVVPDTSAVLDPEFSEGWLCFDRGNERRRLAPIPADWERLSEHELSRLWTTAMRVIRVEPIGVMRRMVDQNPTGGTGGR